MQKRESPYELTKSNIRLYQPTKRMENNCHIANMVHVFIEENC